MFKAIQTRYLSQTNTRGSRITAFDCDGNRATISYPHDLSGEDVHRCAAVHLCAKMGWTGRLIGGALKDGYAFVFADEDGTTRTDASDEADARRCPEPM